MNTSKLSRLLKMALIAGILAGLVMGLFHFLVTERLLDRAIALEEETHAGSGVTETFMVSRGVQKTMLVVGSGLYGLIVGAIFAFVFGVLERRLPGSRPEVKAMILAGAMWWFFGLLAQLKYAATLPGVGDPETAYYRQWLQVGFLALSILAAVVAWVTYRFLGRMRGTGNGARRFGITALVYVAMMALVFNLMPDNPAPPPELAEMSQMFRALSITGHALFWATLGGVMASMLKRQGSEEAAPGRAAVMNPLPH